MYLPSFQQGDTGSYIPPFIIGGGSLIAALLSLLLPETLNRTMPNSLVDAEEFGRGEGICDFRTNFPPAPRHDEGASEGADEGADWRTVTVTAV